MVANNGGALVECFERATRGRAAGRSFNGRTMVNRWRVAYCIDSFTGSFSGVHGRPRRSRCVLLGVVEQSPSPPSSSAFRFPGCGVIRRCYSWLTGCWNLSTRRPWSSNLLATQFHAEILLISYQEECGWAWKERGEEVGGCCLCIFSFLEELLDQGWRLITISRSWSSILEMNLDIGKGLG